MISMPLRQSSQNISHKSESGQSRIFFIYWIYAVKRNEGGITVSCWREQQVLRLPAKAIGIFTEEEWSRFLTEHADILSYDIHHFAPALCSEEYGYFLDFILLDEERECDDGRENACARNLREEEIQMYLPIFQKLFPQFTEEHMKIIHYCRYIWYDGIDAPYCY